MPAFFSLIPWKLVGVVVLCLTVSALWYRGDHYMKAAARLETQLDTAIEVANTNAKIADENAKRADQVQVIVAKGEVKKQAIRREAAAVVGEIANAPADQDGVLAPVLRAELDRLPAPEPDTAKSRAADSHRTVFSPSADRGTDPAARGSDAKGRGAGDRAVQASPELLQRR